jgi:hypothetical protein
MLVIVPSFASAVPERGDDRSGHLGGLVGLADGSCKGWIVAGETVMRLLLAFAMQ